MILRDSHLVDEEPFVVPPLPIQGVFSTMGCEAGRVLLWRRHRERLEHSLRTLAGRAPVGFPGEEELRRLLRVNRCSELARLRLVVWWKKEGREVQMEATCSALTGGGRNRRPLSLGIHFGGVPPDPGHKVVARSWWHDAMEEARRAGFDDALLVGPENLVLESSIANVFVRRDKQILTPPAPARCLPGVMRGVICDLLRDLAFEVIERDVFLDEVLEADEVWLSNATGGALRVGSLGETSWTDWLTHRLLVEKGLPAPGWS